MQGETPASVDPDNVVVMVDVEVEVEVDVDDDESDGCAHCGVDCSSSLTAVAVAVVDVFVAVSAKVEVDVDDGAVATEVDSVLDGLSSPLVGVASLSRIACCCSKVSDLHSANLDSYSLIAASAATPDRTL
jgi:hypothetical protein